MLDFTLERADTCQTANDTDGPRGSPCIYSVKLLHAWAAYFFTENVQRNLTHARAVSTRPSLSEASTQPTYCIAS